MSIITAYIVKEILKGALATLVILVTLINAFTFKDELKHLGEGGYDLQQVIWYVALTTPTTIYELMPSAALLGSLFVLSGMENNRELVAMRVSGMSVGGLVRSVLTAGCILVALSFFIGELLAPNAQREAQLLRSEAHMEKQNVVWQSMYGLWLRDGDSFINVRQIQNDGDLSNVHIFELNNEGRLERMTHAQEVEYIGNRVWRLKQVAGTEFGEKLFRAYFLPQHRWESTIDPDLVNIVVVKADNLSLYNLALYIQYLKSNNQKARSFELAFWGRVVNPFITLVMLMVATPFVIGFSRARSTGPRMFIGVLIGLCFNVIDKIVGNVGLVYELNPLFVAVIPSAIVLGAAMVGIRRIH